MTNDRERLLSAARAGVREAYAKRDTLLVQSVRSVNELNKAANLLFERLSEWYAIYFPELRLQEMSKYCEVVLELEKENIDQRELARIVGEQKAAELAAKAKSSMGIDLQPKDVTTIKKLASQVLQLLRLRAEMETYQDDLARELLPNVSALAEPSLAAKLVSQAGSLEKLARMPASTVQVIGAEKALFKHLRKGTKPPKHGVIFQHPAISTAPREQRGKIARLLAAKIAIAVKADAYSKNFIAEKLKADFEVRLKQIQKK